jgi:hypothetical protein
MIGLGQILTGGSLDWQGMRVLCQLTGTHRIRGRVAEESRNLQSVVSLRITMSIHTTYLYLSTEKIARPRLCNHHHRNFQGIFEFIQIVEPISPNYRIHRREAIPYKMPTCSIPSQACLTTNFSRCGSSVFPGAGLFEDARRVFL